jgi:serine beta-lactamase-like protein LACTB
MSYIKNIFCIVLLLISGILYAQTDRFTKIDALIKTFREKQHIPGIAVAIVENDKIVWMEGVGYADIENHVAATPDTIWRLASISKSISAIAIMQFAENNIMDIDNPIWSYIPWYPRKQYIVTVKNLLTHTSGIRHYKNDNEADSAQHFNTTQDGTKIFGIDKEPLLFKPGTKYLYSSFGYALIAGIIESVTKKSFDVVLREKIFLPAHMNTARLDKPDEIILNRAHFYILAKNGTGVINAPYIDVSYKWSAGGIMASVKDLANFSIALDKNILLKANTLQQVYKPNNLLDGSPTDYGLGWHIEKHTDGSQWVYHRGVATGGTGFLLREPDKGFAIAILCNLGGDLPIKEFAENIAEEIGPNTDKK